jgi:hypothetical protein
MKTRSGFVANSSSSSFIVAVKGDVNVRQEVLDSLKVPKDSPLYKMACELADFFNNAEEDKDWWEDVADKRWGNPKLAKELEGFTVSRVQASSESESPIESMLYADNEMIKIDTPTLKVFAR